MRTCLARAAALIAVVGLTACQTLLVGRIKPGMSAEQVRAEAGAPTEQRKLVEGGMAWFYQQGAQGTATYRVRFDAAGHVVESDQVLTEENFVKKIKPLYTTRDELLANFGEPNNVAIFPRKGEDVWQYRFEAYTTQMLNDVHVDQSTGVVKSFHLYRDPAFTNFGGQD